MKFRAVLLLAGKTATGIEVPPDVVSALGGGKQPPVRVTLGGHTYRSTVAVRRGRHLLPVSGENRERAGVNAGDEVEVTLELDTEPRTADVPDDFAAALDAEPEARRFFDGLTPTQQGYFVASIEEAKTQETRERRIAKALDALRAGRKR